MAICPVCNGFMTLNVTCTACGAKMEDSGREMDFYDDYSAYMPIDQMKLEDGYPNTFSNEECPHLFKCPTCKRDKVVFIKE